MTAKDDGSLLADLGEFGLIERITAALPPHAGVVLGPGDDAAVVAAPDGQVVITVDMLVEGHHFRLDWSSPEDIGHKAAAASLADIAAMGAVPTGLVVGFGAPASLEVEWATRCSWALEHQARQAGATVVGGDVVSSPVVIVSVTAIGNLQGRPPVLRSGARPGDLLALAGRVGESAAGLALLQAGLDVPSQPVAAHRRPHPPYQAGPEAALAGATAMIDISDGLVADARHVARASGVMLCLDTSRIPVAAHLRQAARRLESDVRAWVLQGGEDHALLAAFPSGVAIPTAFEVIGEVQPIDPSVGGPMVTVDGTTWRQGGGFDHFPDLH
jgi:thiamine-monophosphate kinase